jgi:hypothetical protein
LEEYKKQNPTKVETKQQTSFSLEDYRKMNKKSSEETKPPTKEEEKPKTKIQSWKDDDDDDFNVQSSSKLVNPTLKQQETLVNLDNEENEKDLENMFEEVEKVEEIKEKPKCNQKINNIFSRKKRVC